MPCNHRSGKRLACLASVLALGVWHAALWAQAIPASLPTVTVPSAAATGGNASQDVSYRARVEYTNGLLSVSASNSSLNQILRDIGRVTGMTITGGVRDERVFGTYGPADTSTILTTLLDGTGSNVLVVEDARKLPRELVLTPRQGGPTPPNPNAIREEGSADLAPQFTPRVSNQLPSMPAQVPQAQPPQAQSPESLPPNGQPAAYSASESSQPSTNGNTDATPGNATPQQSPGAVKTPQQIYEQLMKLQQQQLKPPQ